MLAEMTDEKPSARDLVEAATFWGGREGEFVLIVNINGRYEGLVNSKIAEFAKIAKRHNQSFGVVNRVVTLREVPHPQFPNRKITIENVRLGIQMPPVVGEKGRILAHFERAEDGKTFYTNVFDDSRRAEAESYIPKLGICEHCNTKRYRKDVFVCDTTEGVKVVGSDCLKDFIGIDPILSVKGLEFLRFASSSESDLEERFFGGGDNSIDTTYLVRECYKVAKHFGGYSREVSDEMRTHLDIILNGPKGNKDRAAIYAIYYNWKKEPVFNPELDLYKLADYVETMQGDFGSNLRIAFGMPRVELKRMNIILAGVGLFVGKIARIDKEAEAKAALPPAKLVDAEPGTRVDLLGTVLRTTPYTSDFGGGVVVVVRCVGGENLLHFYSGNDEVEAGKTYTIRATVKKHGTDKRSGEPQTVVSRAVYLPEATYAIEMAAKAAKAAKKAARDAKASGDLLNLVEAK